MDVVSERTLEIAMETFWEVIAKAHPNIQSGDLPPETALSFENVCRSAYGIWLIFNTPSEEFSITGEYELTVEGGKMGTNLKDFILANQESMSADEVYQALHLEPGQELIYGGGSAGVSVLKRVK